MYSVQFFAQLSVPFSFSEEVTPYSSVCSDQLHSMGESWNCSPRRKPSLLAPTTSWGLMKGHSADGGSGCQLESWSRSVECAVFTSRQQLCGKYMWSQREREKLGCGLEREAGQWDLKGSGWQGTSLCLRVRWGLFNKILEEITLCDGWHGTLLTLRVLPQHTHFSLLSNFPLINKSGSHVSIHSSIRMYWMPTLR